MNLKLSKLFSITVIIILSGLNTSIAFGLTAQEVTEKYPHPASLQIAIDQGEINYHDLPDSFHEFVHDKVNPNDTTAIDGWFSLAMFVISGLLIIFQMKSDYNNLIRYGVFFFTALTISLGSIWLIGSMDFSGKFGASVIAGAVLFGIGITFIIKGYQFDDQINRAYQVSSVERIADKTTGAFPKGFKYNINPPMLRLGLVQKILLTIGIMKVKKID